MSQFSLPDLGEGLQGAEILEWKVKVGDAVKADQLILIVETAKAIVEIPAPVDATIETICVQVGETVDVGTTLMEYKENHQLETKSPKSVSVVGELSESRGADSVLLNDEILTEETVAVQEVKRRSESLLAPPAVSLFAEKLGATEYLETGSYGATSESNLLELFRQKQSSDNKECQSDPIMQLKGARKVMAQTMSRSHEQIPAVTLFDDALISHWSGEEDVTIRCVRALIHACSTVPIFNAWFDEEAMRIQFFKDINLGVAVNSEEGLFVPVIRGVQKLEEGRIRNILEKQIDSIRDRSIKPQKLLGATISISNFGSLSGRYATPIIVPPQVSIVGIGKIRKEPVVVRDKLEVGKIIPLSLSFDHRAASGAEAAQFMRAMIESLEAE